jgi:drug/metabolite transporter (DMT)-like permease
MNPLASARARGALLAGCAAAVSGVSVLLNSHAVRDFPDAASYTTAKNAIAAVLLALGALALRGSPRRGSGTRRAPRRWTPGEWLGLAYVGLIGGGVAFVLFFTGLQRTSAVPAAFLHDTLILWVALAGVPLLGERLSAANLGALGALLIGEVALSGGVGGLHPNVGNLLVLAATLLWAGEVIIAKVLLRSVPAARLATARMGIGLIALLAYLAARGDLGSLTRFDARQIGWILATGALLGAYVASWFGALAAARAVDVTSVLVTSVAITAVLQAALGTLAPSAAELVGIALIAIGAAVVALRWPRTASDEHGGAMSTAAR